MRTYAFNENRWRGDPERTLPNCPQEFAKSNDIKLLIYQQEADNRPILKFRLIKRNEGYPQTEKWQFICNRVAFVIHYIL